MKPHVRHSKHVTRGKRWKALRVQILSRDGHKCRACGSRRRLEVDHVKPVRTHPELSFDPDNLATRCASCHSKKTRLECGHQPVPEGRQAWQDSVLTLACEGKTYRAMEKRNA